MGPEFPSAGIRVSSFDELCSMGSGSKSADRYNPLLSWSSPSVREAELGKINI